MSENIAKTLNDLVIDINEVKPRDKNPRRGDIDVIKESLKANGQYRPIVVNKKTDEVLAGNHTLKAAKALGWKKIAATFVDVSEEEAQRIVLVDNRANDLADYDEFLLAEIIKELDDDLLGTGFTKEAADAIIAQTTIDFEPEAADSQPQLDSFDPITCPHCGGSFVRQE